MWCRARRLSTGRVGRGLWARLGLVRPTAVRYDETMPTLTAGLHHGQLLLRDGSREGMSPLNLVVDDEGDDLDDAEWERLEAVIAESTAQFARGEFVTADEVLERLRARRR